MLRSIHLALAFGVVSCCRIEAIVLDRISGVGWSRLAVLYIPTEFFSTDTRAVGVRRIVGERDRTGGACPRNERPVWFGAGDRAPWRARWGRPYGLPQICRTPESRFRRAGARGPPVRLGRSTVIASNRLSAQRRPTVPDAGATSGRLVGSGVNAAPTGQIVKLSPWLAPGSPRLRSERIVHRARSAVCVPTGGWPNGLSYVETAAATNAPKAKLRSRPPAVASGPGRCGVERV